MAYVPVTDLSFAGQEPVCAAVGGGAARAATRFGSVRHLFAALLLFAAALKAHAAAADPIIQAGLRGSLWPHVASVSIEILLASWLLSNLHVKWACRASLLVLTIFAAVSGYHLLRGDSSCGCFGKLEVHPAWTLALDLSLAAALWRYQRSGEVPAIPSPETARAPWLFSAAICAALAAGFWMTGAWEAVIYGRSAAASNLRVLEPQAWVGQSFPLLPHLRPSESLQQLSHGDCLVVLYHEDCSECRQLLPRVADAARKPNGVGGGLRYAFIEISPGADQASAESILVAGCTRLVLDPAYRWFAQTPTFVWLSDGVVTRASRQWP